MEPESSMMPWMFWASVHPGSFWALAEALPSVKPAKAASAEATANLLINEFIASPCLEGDPAPHVARSPWFSRGTYRTLTGPVQARTNHLQSSGDDAVTDHEIAVHQTGDLARRRTVNGLTQRNGRLVRSAARLEPTGPLGRVVAEPDTGDTLGSAVQRRPTDPDEAGRELLARSCDHPIRDGIRGEDVQGLAAPHPDPLALTDREVVMAAVGPDPATGPVDDLAGALIEPGVPAQELALSLTGEEAEVLALGPARHLELRAGGNLTHLRLGELAEREAKAGERGRAKAGEHVGLILGVVHRRREQGAGAVVGDPGVMAGGELRRAESVGERDHRVDPQLAVAEHAGVRGPALGVPLDEGRDDAGAELVLEIEGQVRDAERMGDAASAEHRLGRAAAPFSIRALVRPELQRDGHHVPARLGLAERGNGRVDSTAERDQDPLAARRARSQRRPRAGEAGKRPVQRIGRQ